MKVILDNILVSLQALSKNLLTIFAKDNLPLSVGAFVVSCYHEFLSQVIPSSREIVIFNHFTPRSSYSPWVCRKYFPVGIS